MDRGSGYWRNRPCSHLQSGRSAASAATVHFDRSPNRFVPVSRFAAWPTNSGELVSFSDEELLVHSVRMLRRRQLPRGGWPLDRPSRDAFVRAVLPRGHRTPESFCSSEARDVVVSGDMGAEYPRGADTRTGLTKWGKDVAQMYHRDPAPHHRGDPATSPRVPVVERRGGPGRERTIARAIQ
jgi:hypothetical protein